MIYKMWFYYDQKQKMLCSTTDEIDGILFPRGSFMIALDIDDEEKLINKKALCDFILLQYMESNYLSGLITFDMLCKMAVGYAKEYIFNNNLLNLKIEKAYITPFMQTRIEITDI